MLAQLSTAQPSLDDEVHISYLVKKKKGGLSRIASATLIEMSEAGMCLEISPLDSELFLESQGNFFILNKNVEIQIFCRSHPNNVSVEGCVKWFKLKKEIQKEVDDGNILVGIIFSFWEKKQKEEMVDLVRRFNKQTIRCGECNTHISEDAALCYNCGSRSTRKRDFLKRMLSTLLNGGEEDRPD